MQGVTGSSPVASTIFGFNNPKKPEKPLLKVSRVFLRLKFILKVFSHLLVFPIKILITVG